jgi:hypothetical protein
MDTLNLRPLAWAAVLALLILGMTTAQGRQQAFASPEAAMEAFGNAVATSDERAMAGLLGDEFRALIPPVGAEARFRFLGAWAQSHAVRPEGRFKASIAVGDDGWTLPIPLVRTAEGWRFDTRAGAEEMRVRRIGRNELAAMQVVLAIYDAEKEYARLNPKGDGVLQYAARLASSPGKRDGLYWPTKVGEPPSPLGELVAAARAAGSRAGAGYHGYHFWVLTGQG